VTSATTSDFNVYLRQSVLAGILSKLGSVSPVIFPTGTLAQMANQMANVSSQSPQMDVNGVNIGSDGSLKLGFAFSYLPSCIGCQPAAPFDPSPYFNPGAEPTTDYDWNLDIIPGFFMAAIQAQVQSQIQQQFPSYTPAITDVVPSLADPNPGAYNSGITLTIYADAPSSCGSWNFSSVTTVTMQMSADTSGDSVLQVSQTKPTNPNPGPGDGFKYGCWLVDQGVAWFFRVFDVGTVIPTSACPNVLGSPIKLSTPSGDVLYGTGTVTRYGDLVILGRSKMLDEQYAQQNPGSPPRTTVPPCQT
jgi:hypothetical protein